MRGRPPLRHGLPVATGHARLALNPALNPAVTAHLPAATPTWTQHAVHHPLRPAQIANGVVTNATRSARAHARPVVTGNGVMTALVSPTRVGLPPAE